MPPAAKDKVSILIVDDDRGFRECVSCVLEDSGYNVRQAETGEEAVDSVRQQRPALVVIDVVLPGMSGYEVCRILRLNHGDALPIVFVSGARAESFDRVAGLRLGADDYLIKPIDPAELLARIDRLVGRTQWAMARSATGSFELTRRETDVLELLVAGSATKEIARDLSISRKTVAVHIQNILMKLGVHSQGQAIAVAVANDLIVMRRAAALAPPSRNGQNVGDERRTRRAAEQLPPT